jgi:hypothetical protein
MKVCSNGFEVTNRARDLIAQHPHFRGRAHSFDFEWSGNVLVVRGCVPTFYLKQLLQDALKRVQGIERIDNRVDVFSYESTDPQ